MVMEQALGVVVISDALAEIEAEGLGFGHGKCSENGDGKTRRRALSRRSGFTRVPSVLFLSGEAGQRRCRVQASSPVSARNSAIRSWVDLARMRSPVINTAMPPKPSGRIFEHSKEVMAVT